MTGILDLPLFTGPEGLILHSVTRNIVTLAVKEQCRQRRAIIDRIRVSFFVFICIRPILSHLELPGTLPVWMAVGAQLSLGRFLSTIANPTCDIPLAIRPVGLDGDFVRLHTLLFMRRC
jgi:hypothetical protein